MASTKGAAKKAPAKLDVLDIAAVPLDERLAKGMILGTKLTQRWGSGTLAIPGLDPAPFRKRIYSSGLASLDQKLQIGGYPSGTIVEFFGPPHVGKSLLLYMLISEVQHTCSKCEGRIVYGDRIDGKGRTVFHTVNTLVRGEPVELQVPIRDSLCKNCSAPNSGGLVILFDQENSVDPNWLTAQNVEITKLIVAKMPTGEEATEMARTLILQLKPELVAIDSIAQLQPEAEQLKSEVDDKIMPGLHAKIMARLCRQITSLFLMDPVAAPLVAWVNQVRADVTGYGKDVVTGGFAPEHYSAIRLKVSGGTKKVNQDKPELGVEGSITIKKCKVAKGAKNRAITHILTDEGFDRVTDLYNTSVALGVWNTTKLGSGQHFWADEQQIEPEKRLANKRDEALERMRTQPEFFDEVLRRTNRSMIVAEPINMEQGAYLGDGVEDSNASQEPESEVDETR